MRLRVWLIGLLALAFSLLFGVRDASAQDDGEDPPEEKCIQCHSGLESFVTFGDGDRKSIQIDIEGFENSIHGEELTCISCHGDYEFPHPDSTEQYDSERDFSVQWVSTCRTCHATEYDLAEDSVHQEALDSGNLNAALCSDCHGYHTVTEAFPERPEISRTCGNCHQAIFDVYQESVHGAALLEQGNPDVPTCINCHGVHNIEHPTTNLFRVRSPLLCANCHADEALMDKYGISTQVFETYVADFHGTTVTLFEHLDPNIEVNKAVCYDCHGVHDIRSPDDPQSRVVRENLVNTCRRCHPDASEEFAAAWTKHYIPDADRYPLVFFVDTFYKILIPATLGFMIVFVISDVYRRVINAARRGKQPGSWEE